MSKEVLVVESNRFLVRIYQSIFRAIDCRVHHAAGATAALRILVDRTPDLIVIDEHIFDGHSVALMRKIRSNSAFFETPIVATVARPNVHAEYQPATGGFSSLVIKPFKLVAFSELIKRHLGRGPLSQS